MSKDNQGQGPAEAAARFAKEEILGARQWRRSRLGSLTGLSTLADGGRATKAQGAEAVGRVKGLFGLAFRKDTSGKAVPESVTDPRERFLMSMQRNGKTAQDIARSVSTTYLQFWLYLSLVAATLVFALLTFPWNEPGRGALATAGSVLFRLIPMPLLLALLLRAGWTNWAFRRFRLDSPAEYLGAGAAMLPRKALEGRKPSASRSVAARIGLIVALGLGSLVAMHAMQTPALADTLSDGQAYANKVFVDPPQNDVFIRLLSYVIPNAGPVPANSLAPAGGGPYDLIRTGLSSFAATLLFIGMMMSGWQIITGIVASAKEGTAIGRNYHEVWAPVRTVIGYGMLVPVANGLCGAQILCLYLIAWGGNLANIIWGPYVEKAVVTTTTTNAGTLASQAVDTVGSSISDSLIQSIFEKELCRSTLTTMKLRKVWANAVTDFVGINGNGAAAPDTSPSFVNTSGTLNYFSKNEVWAADYGKICGTLEISVPKAANTATTSRTEAGTNGLPTTVNLDTSYEDNRAHMLGLSRKDAVDGMRAAIAPIAEQAARTYQVGTSSGKSFSEIGALTPDQVADAKKNYLKSLKSLITMNADWNQSPGAQGIMDAMRQQAQADGWAKAGTYYLTITRMQSNLYSSLFGGVKSSPLSFESSAAVSKTLAEYLFGRDTSSGVIPQFRSWWRQNIGAISGDASANLTKAGSNSVFDSISDFSLWTGSIFMHLDVNPLNPMGAMIEYGDFLMRTGFGIYLSIMAINQGSSLLGLAAGSTVLSGGAAAPSLAIGAISTISSAAFQAIATPLTLVAGAIIMAGALHSYVIPMMPYILVLFFVCGMLMLTVESLVAAPLWAFFHIRLDGQEFIDQVQKPGYMIAFNLLLRPVLMIFGLILSTLVFGAMSWFINETFMPVANGLASSTTVGPIGAAVLVVMLAVINLNIASKSFHLITEIPDRVSRWFGQGGEQLGEQRDSGDLKTAVLGAVTSRGESMIGTAMTGKLANGIGRGNRNQGRGNALAGLAESQAEEPGGGAPGAPPGAGKQGEMKAVQAGKGLAGGKA